MRPEYDFTGAVREYFPDSESVNAALRSLIALMAELPATRKRKPATKNSADNTLNLAGIQLLGQR